MCDHQYGSTAQVYKSNKQLLGILYENLGYQSVRFFRVFHRKILVVTLHSVYAFSISKVQALA